MISQEFKGQAIHTHYKKEMVDFFVTMFPELKEEGKYPLVLRSKEDFRFLHRIELDEYFYPITIFRNNLILVNIKDRSTQKWLNLESLEIEDIYNKYVIYYNTDEYFETNEYSVRLDTNSKQYDIFRSDKYINTHEISTRKFYVNNQGIYRLVKDDILDEHIECLDFETLEPVWQMKKDEWEIKLVDVHKNYLLVHEHIYNERMKKNRKNRTISFPVDYEIFVIDTTTGKEIWRHQGSNAFIDHKTETVIARTNDTFTELDLATGKVVREIVPEVKISFYIIRILDDGMLYAAPHKKHIGKINRFTGKIEYEYRHLDLLPEAQSISQFYELENGKVVINVRNNKDSYSIHVFDPAENEEFNNIKNGERIHSYP